MLQASEYGMVLVTIGHPWGPIEVPLTEWILKGPPRSRPYVQIIGARRRLSGEPVPLEEIPAEYRNTVEARRLQHAGLLPTPWGPPPVEPEESEDETGRLG